LSQTQLFQRIIELSNSKFWDAAKLEWRVSNIEISDDPETCLCGKFPIIELCHLLNKVNGNQTTVGNHCVNKFLPNLSSSKIMAAFKRIRKNIEKSLNSEFIELALENKWINKWERDFYLDVMRKQKLTDKQKDKKIQINEKVVFNVNVIRKR
jgi:hypothetical protein